MRIDDRLVKQNQELLKKKKKKQQEEDEETLSYAERLKMKPLNKNKGAFEGSEGNGINNSPSIFDRTAIFHTGEDY